MFRDRKRPADPGQPRGADDAIDYAANVLPHARPASLPEISLVAAIFKDGVRCVQRGARDVTHRQSLEAFEWIASERRDWPFAFVNVCELLGLDATAVRTRLRI